MYLDEQHKKFVGMISKNKITEYMSKHQHDKDASPLWTCFTNMIETTFPNKRKEYTKKVNWGPLYDKYKNTQLNQKKLEKEITKLLLDKDVTKLKGIYPYVLTRNEKYLSIRTFDKDIKQRVYERQKGVCKICKKRFGLSEMDADHKNLGAKAEEP